MIRFSSSASRRSSRSCEARACQPKGSVRPGAWAYGSSHVTDTHGPPTRVKRYDEKGGVVPNVQASPCSPDVRSSSGPLASTVQCDGAVTPRVNVDLMSGWSKQGMTFWVMSIEVCAQT